MLKPTKRMPLPLVLLPFLACTAAQQIRKSESGKIYWKETVVAGGPDHFLEVRHVVLKGSNYEMGRKIGEMARKANIVISPSGDSLRNRVQREYIAKNYPMLYERMRGVADAYGLNIEDDAYDFSGLSQYPSSGPGCSVVFFPEAFTENGHSILSRNYDFTLGTAEGRRPGENETALMSRPHIFEMHPEQGYASLSLCAFDLLGGVLDGINSEGLVVAVLADEETMVNYGSKPFGGIGMHELLCLRYLLDNCKDVEEAKEAMLSLKHYYSFMPCHYIIGDRSGKSFVFEFSALRNSTFIIDGEGPQWVTNHLLSNYQSIDQLPRGGRIDSYDRYRELQSAIKVHLAVRGRARFSVDKIRAINSSVANTGMAFDHPDYAPNRTLWHALYDVGERSMSVKFYLGENRDRSDKKETAINYSDYLNFELEASN